MTQGRSAYETFSEKNEAFSRGILNVGMEIQQIRNELLSGI